MAYDDFVDVTCIHRDTIYPLLGLGGELGEFMELAKKAYRESGPQWIESIDREKAISELGDIVWYIARISRLLETSIYELLEYNMSKLTERHDAVHKPGA